METPGTRHAASEARKAQIAEATIAVLADRGYAATTFEAICEQARLSSKRLISYHFAGKDELFATVVRRVLADAAAFARPALDAAPDARARLLAYVRAHVAYAAAHPDRVRAVRQIAVNAGSPDYEAAVGEVATLLADGQRTGAFRSFDPALMAAVFRAGLDVLPELPYPDRYADELADTVDRATRPG
jgi:AcrR family transcriptional regulator